MIPRLTGLLLLGALACSGDASSGQPSEVEHTAAEAPPTSAASRWVQPQVPREPALLSAPATVQSPQSVGEVALDFRGRLSRLHTSPGAKVQAGDPVAEVVAPEVLDAAAQFITSYQGAREKQRRAEELESLTAEGFATKSDLMEAREEARQLASARERALATLRAAGIPPADASALLKQGSITLRAPLAGVVTELPAHLGESLEPGATVAMVVGEGPARVEVRVSTKIPEPQSVQLQTSDGRTIPLATEPVSSVLDPTTGTWRGWYEPNPPVALPHGLTGTVLFGVKQGVWELPRAAVGREADRALIQVQRGTGEPMRMPVRVVAASGTSVLVEADLQSTDRVAARFSQALSAADPGPHEREPSSGGTP